LDGDVIIKPITEAEYQKILMALAYIKKQNLLNKLCEENIKPLMKVNIEVVLSYAGNNNLMPYGREWLSIRREIKRKGAYVRQKAKPVYDFSGPSWSHTTNFIHSATITITAK